MERKTQEGETKPGHVTPQEGVLGLFFVGMFTTYFLGVLGLVIVALAQGGVVQSEGSTPLCDKPVRSITGEGFHDR